jgi:hypothetical protein
MSLKSLLVAFAVSAAALVPLAAPPSAQAGWVTIGGVRFPDNASRYVIYYRYIPGVANPGFRPRVYNSYADMTDAMRRAKNNGWLVDFSRSYYVP